MQIEHHFRNTAKELHLARHPYGPHAPGHYYNNAYQGHGAYAAGFPHGYPPYGYNGYDPNLMNQELANSKDKKHQYDDYQLKDGHLYRPSKIEDQRRTTKGLDH